MPPPIPALPYAPRTVYRSRYADTIAQLLARQGDIASEGAARSGAIWGPALAGLGQVAGQAIQAHQEQQAQSKRDAALSAFVDSGIWAKDPQAALAGSVKILGPEKGPKFAEGLIGAAKLGQGEDPMKALPMVARGLLAAPDSMKPGLYSRTRELLIHAKVGTAEDWPEKFGADMLPMISAIAGQEQKQNAGFTLSPGEVRYGPDGKVIATGPPKSEKPEKTLGEIRAEAAARAAGTASVKPPTEPGVVSAYVEDLRQGHKIWADVPANLRNQVQAAASQAGVAAPTKRPSEKAITELAEAQDLVTRTGELLVMPAGVQEWAKAEAIPDWVTQMTGWGASAKANRSEFFLYMAQTLKSIQGSRPSDKDMEWYMANLPRQADPPEVRNQKTQRIQERITRLYNARIKGLKASGYALGGFDELLGTDKEPPG